MRSWSGQRQPTSGVRVAHVLYSEASCYLPARTPHSPTLLTGCTLYNDVYITYITYILMIIYVYIYMYYYYTQTLRFGQAQKNVNYKDFLFTLYISYKFSPPPLNSYLRWRSSIRVNFPTPVKLFHSLKIFNKGSILPPPLNSSIHWRSSIRV